MQEIKDIKEILNRQEEKINRLSTTFEEICFNQQKILDMLYQNNKQMQLLQTKKRLKTLFYFFFIMFIVYYFNIWEFIINYSHYYNYFIDYLHQIKSINQNTEMIYDNIQQILQNQEKVLVKMDTNKQFLEQIVDVHKSKKVDSTSFSIPKTLETFYFKNK